MTHHFEIIHHPTNGKPHVVRYAMNWRQARAMVRGQAKERPGEKITIRRVKPEPRWVLRSYTYRMIRDFDRNQKRLANGHPTSRSTR